MSPSDIKKKNVEEFTKLMDEYPVIAAVNMENLPAKQLQSIVSSLRDKMLLKMGKRRLIKLAIEKSKKDNIKEMEQYLQGMPALIFSKESPFKLYKILEKSKTNAPAKAGQKAPKDLIVPAGPTGFAPGPIISELSGIGIKTSIENGKVAVKSDSVVAKEGEVISQKVASVLSRMGIEPMEIGLNIVAVYENGSIFKKDILSIDESKYIADIEKAARDVFNLSIEIGYVTKDNIQFLITKAFNDSKNLAISEDLITDLTLGNVIGKAEAQMKNLANKLNLPEVKKMEKPKKEIKEKTQEQPKEETKVEEIKEEPKVEKEPEKVEVVEEEKVEESKEEVSEEKVKEKKEITEEPAKEKIKEESDEKKNNKEKTLEEASEKEIQKQHPTTDEDIKKAEENLKMIQEKIQKS